MEWQPPTDASGNSTQISTEQADALIRICEAQIGFRTARQESLQGIAVALVGLKTLADRTLPQMADAELRDLLHRGVNHLARLVTSFEQQTSFELERLRWEADQYAAMRERAASPLVVPRMEFRKTRR